MVVDGNQGSKPNYEPNSHGTFVEDPNAHISPYKVTGFVQRYKPNHPNSDFSQPGVLFRKVMDNEKRKILIDNIVGHLKNANKEIQERQVRIFFKCDPEYGNRVAEGLGIPAIKSRL